MRKGNKKNRKVLKQTGTISLNLTTKNHTSGQGTWVNTSIVITLGRKARPKNVQLQERPFKCTETNGGRFGNSHL